MENFHNELSGESKIGIQAVSINEPVINQTFNQISNGRYWEGKLSNIPRSASHKFTGRESLLVRLQDCLVRTPNCKVHNRMRAVFILFGLGGSGKTQVALKFAELHKNTFGARFWLSAENKDSVRQSYSEIAGLSGLEKSQEAGKALLESTENWLLVIDNADDASNDFSIRAYSQEYDRNHKELLTSYPNQGADSYGFSVFATWRTSLRMMQTQDRNVAEAAKDILNVCTHYDHKEIPKFLIHSAAVTASTDGAWMTQTGLHLLYSKPFSSIFFRPNFSTFVDHSRCTKQCMKQYTKMVDEAIVKLSCYSLVRLQEECVSMHSLVQSWARYESDSVSHTARRWGRQTAMAALERVIETGDAAEQYEMRRKLYPHVRCFVEPKDETMKIEITAAVSAKFARAAFDFGNFTMAESLYQKALESLKAKSWFFRNDSEICNSLDGLVSAQERQGRYMEAMENAEKLVRGRTRCLGDNHIKTWRAKAQLALAQQGTGDYQSAHNINQSLLEEMCSLDSEDRDIVFTAEVIKNHADVLFREGKHCDATELLKAALELREEAIGLTHPETLETMASLADALTKQDQLVEANHFAALAYERRQEILGKTHPDTLSSLRTLGNVYYHRGQYTASMKSQQRVLESRKSILGINHIDTITTFNELAKVQLALGDYQTAEANFRTALEGFEAQLGGQHPYNLIPQINIAMCFRYQAKYKQAEELYVKVLAEFEHRGDPDHPDALTCKSNLAAVFHDDGKLSDAEILKREVLRAHEQTSDVASVNKYRSLLSLAYTIAESPGRYQEADDMMRRAIEGLEMTIGSESQESLDAICQRAYLLWKSKKYEHSWLLFRGACSALEKLGIDDHWCFKKFRRLEEVMKQKGLELPITPAVYDSVYVTTLGGLLREVVHESRVKRKRSTDSENVSSRVVKVRKVEQDNAAMPQWQKVVREVLGMRMKDEDER
ncbi:hypothetical protein J7T55_007161 [Diaporthe amygdali]|uniref:uncharacterized protein n=1 Tax=Phomopsis amygdali TaxID=1214568 RepID=UPI0022FE0866|nr:uncharacterized protein J7T55_007161 [Diaporthe amygdali]KAJ0108043.1 hypothetical protein J7T55_007161 [Diaporthe amygdali]